MSVVVRMEMPDWCPCVLAEDNNGWYGPCFAYNGIPERAKEFDQCVENMKRPSWCPIVCSLPEGHGRLVDADALEDGWIWGETDRLGKCECVELWQIKTAPTIVPADTAERSET